MSKNWWVPNTFQPDCIMSVILYTVVPYINLGLYFSGWDNLGYALHLACLVVLHWFWITDQKVRSSSQAATWARHLTLSCSWGAAAWLRCSHRFLPSRDMCRIRYIIYLWDIKLWFFIALVCVCWGRRRFAGLTGLAFIHLISQQAVHSPQLADFLEERKLSTVWLSTKHLVHYIQPNILNLAPLFYLLYLKSNTLH